jgi:hypothetical protein
MKKHRGILLARQLERKYIQTTEHIFLNVTVPGLIDANGTFCILITAVKRLEIVYISSCQRLKGNCYVSF